MSGGRTPLQNALDLLEAALADGERRRAVDALVSGGDTSRALFRLRGMMASHAIASGGGAAHAFDRAVRKLDHRTRQDGFHVLHNWNPRLHRFTDDIVPVLMLDHYVREAEAPAPERVVLEILLDYYLLHVLTLCAMRAWDGDADAVLDRVAVLVERLQGPDGSGHRFVGDAETLIIYALSQFHPDERAYDRVIERIETLRPERRLAFAAASAAVLGAHLRWGFWLMYGRDVVRMRNDNVGDYPWLLSSVVTLLREYARLNDAGIHDAHRDRVVGALLLGLAADPWAFTGKAPAALSEWADEHGEARALLERHGPGLLDELEGHRPSKEAYAPLSLHFNFPHNALVALLSMALLAGAPQPTPLNALFERDAGGQRAALARAMTDFAGGSASRLGARGAMLVAYDPYSGLRSFTLTVDALRKAAG